MPFALPVVPEVNNKTCISSGFILISSKLVLPLFSFAKPCLINSFIFSILLSLDVLFMFINLILDFNLFLLSIILLIYFSSPITASASDILIKFITSSTCNSLSIGTAIPIIAEAKYEEIQE